MTNNSIKNSIIKVGTFFSGIGSPEKALHRLKEEGHIKDYKVEFFSEIDRNAIKSYCAIHNVDESLNLGSILNIKGKDLPYCDLWIGGFPCQDISCAGRMRGFDYKSDTRSSLGWQMIRLLKEVSIKPKYVIFENVASITSNKFKETLNLFKQDLMNLGYNLFEKILNAVDYGIPQTRKRYFLVAILDKNKKFTFPTPIAKTTKLSDFLDRYVPEEYYLTTGEYIEKGIKRIFHKKDRKDIIYEIDLDNFLLGKMCGIDKHSKFAQSSRLYSFLGYAPTLTASNTSDNCKLVIEDEKEEV